MLIKRVALSCLPCYCGAGHCGRAGQIEGAFRPLLCPNRYNYIACCQFAGPSLFSQLRTCVLEVSQWRLGSRPSSLQQHEGEVASWCPFSGSPQSHHNLNFAVSSVIPSSNILPPRLILSVFLSREKYPHRTRGLTLVLEPWLVHLAANLRLLSTIVRR
jgi:hypothetical protein